MEKCGIIIKNGYSHLEGIANYISRMEEEFSKKGVRIEVIDTTDLIAFIDGDGSLKTRIPPCDFILFLDKDVYLSHALEKAGYRLFNSADAIELCDDKMRTHLFLMDHKIPMPKTVSSPLNYTGILKEDFLKKVADELGYPVIGKECYGSMGKGVRLLKDFEELKAFEEKSLNSSHFYQSYIPYSKGTDYRLIVIGGKFVAGMRRHNDSDFRSNIAQGGHGEIVEMPKPFIELAERVSKLLQLDYCGIDLLMGEHGEPIFCEANSNAFMKGIESVTGINVAERYVDWILSEIR